jgi:hypothetical protein
MPPIRGFENAFYAVPGTDEHVGYLAQAIAGSYDHAEVVFTKDGDGEAIDIFAGPGIDLRIAAGEVCLALEKDSCRSVNVIRYVEGEE